MNDKTKIMGALALGAIAGAVIVKLLESDKGKELVDSAKEKAKATSEDIKSKINQLQNELAELLDMQQDADSSNQV